MARLRRLMGRPERRLGTLLAEESTMQDPPQWQELLSAVQAQLEDEVIPNIQDPGIRFRTLIAANLLRIVQREHQLGSEQAQAEQRRLLDLLGAEPGAADLPELTSRLLERVRAGEFDHDPARQQLMAHLKATAIERLRIANPRFLSRLDAEDSAEGKGEPA